MQNPITRLRNVGLAEGTSFLLLLGVAMPLKYLADMPMAVRVVGWAHGLLFIAFCLALLQAHRYAKWSIGRSFIFFMAGLVPFGPFLVDRKLRAEGERA
jgi:integral membrane protein